MQRVSSGQLFESVITELNGTHFQLATYGSDLKIKLEMSRFSAIKGEKDHNSVIDMRQDQCR